MEGGSEARRLRRQQALDLVAIAACETHVGSTAQEVERCVQEWGPRLVDPSYDVESFRRWIAKEYPRHEVALAAYSIGRYPVTNAEYAAFVQQAGVPRPESIERGEPASHPVWGVALPEARSFARWLGEQTGLPLRLPSEAEWEHAARGPAGHRYPYGDSFDPARANTLESGIGMTTPVDRYASGVSGFGLWDLAGNVEEWTDSLYEPYPGGERIEDDLSRLLGPRYPILRGGSFARGGDLSRCARRHGAHPAPEFRYTGFRLAMDGGRGAAR